MLQPLLQCRVSRAAMCRVLFDLLKVSALKLWRLVFFCVCFPFRLLLFVSSGPRQYLKQLSLPPLLPNLEPPQTLRNGWLHGAEKRLSCAVATCMCLVPPSASRWMRHDEIQAASSWQAIDASSRTARCLYPRSWVGVPWVAGVMAPALAALDALSLAVVRCIRSVFLT